MLLIIHYWLILIWLNILVLRNTVSQCPAIKDCIHNDESKVTNIGNWICKIFQYLISHERVGIILSDAGQTHISDSVSRCSFHSKVTSLNHWLEMRPKKRAFNKVQKFSIVPTGKSPIHIHNSMLGSIQEVRYIIHHTVLNSKRSRFKLH